MVSYAKIASAYEKGDHVTAYKGFKNLAEQGDADAQYNLGGMYHNGDGVPPDLVRAHMWFDIAGSEYFRDRLAGRMSSSQIDEAHRLASEWKLRRQGKQEPRQLTGRFFQD